MTKRAGLSDSSFREPWGELATWNGNFATALGHMGTAYTKACVEWQQEIARFVGARADQDRQVWESLTNCRDQGDLAKAQQDWTARATKDYLDEAARLTEIASQFAKIAMTPLHDAGHPAPSGKQQSKAAD